MGSRRLKNHSGSLRVRTLHVKLEQIHAAPPGCKRADQRASTSPFPHSVGSVTLPCCVLESHGKKPAQHKLVQALLLAQQQLQALLLAQMAVGIMVTVSHLSIMIFGSVDNCDGHTPNLVAAIFSWPGTQEAQQNCMKGAGLLSSCQNQETLQTYPPEG